MIRLSHDLNLLYLTFLPNQMLTWRTRALTVLNMWEKKQYYNKWLVFKEMRVFIIFICLFHVVQM